MDVDRLEFEFTNMLKNTGTLRAWEKLGYTYFNFDEDYKLLNVIEAETKISTLRLGDPKEWISKLFTEGLQMPKELYQVNVLWLQHLEEKNWE